MQRPNYMPRLYRIWQIVPLVLINIFLVVSCGGGSGKDTAKSIAAEISSISGSLSVADENGQPFKTEGATVEIEGIEEFIRRVNSGKTNTEATSGPSSTDKNGEIRLSVEKSKISSRELYVVTFKCKDTPTCELNTPIHIVLEGSQLLASNWSATALTEIAYQKIAYYVAAGYSVDEMQQTLNNNAGWLLHLDLTGDSVVNYEDVIAWRPFSPESKNALRKSEEFSQFSGSLNEFISNNKLKTLAQEISNPLLSNLDFDSDIYSAAYSEDFAYLASSKGLVIVDYRDPLNPAITNTMDQIINPLSVAVNGDYAFTVENSPGDGGTIETATLRVLSLQDKANPTVLSELTINPVFTDDGAKTFEVIAIKDDYLYVATASHLQIVNIQDPKAPKLVQTQAALNLGGPRRGTSIQLYYDVAIVTTPYSVHSYDIGNPEEPKPLYERWYTKNASDRLENQNVFSTHIYQNYLIISKGTDGLEILDLNSGKNQSIAAEIELPGFSLFSRTYGDKLFVTDSYAATIHVVDISDITQPEYIARLNSTATIRGLKVGEQRAFISDASGFRVMDIEQVSAVIPTNVHSIGTNDEVTSLLLHGAVAYLGKGSELITADITDSDQPKFMSVQLTPHYVNDLVVYGNYLYIANANQGIKVFDISNPLAPIAVNENITQTTSNFTGLALHKGYLYVSAGTEGIYVYDLSNPSEPKDILHRYTGGFSRNLTIIGDELIVADTTGFIKYHIAAPDNLIRKNLLLFPKLSRFNSLTITNADGVLYTTDSNNSLQIHDAKDTDNIRTIEIEPFLFDAVSVTIAGKHAYVGDRSSNIHILDISNPETPFILGSADLIGTAKKIIVHNKLVYVATTYGLEILKAMPEE